MNFEEASKYDGTTIKLGAETARTWFLLNFSWIPFANLYTAIHLNIPLSFKVQLGYMIQASMLITLTIYLMKNMKVRTSNPFGNKGANLSLIAKLVPLVLYTFSATASHSVTPKYQNEIKILGQVYMSYSVVLMTACTLLAVFILLSKSRILVFLLGLIAIGNLAVNSSISQTFDSSMNRNNQLIESFESGSFQDRCEALEQWKLIGWPDYYRDGMELGLSYSFKSVRGSNFCKN
jgi:hypothetical protein